MSEQTVIDAPDSDFTPAKSDHSGMIEVATGRAAQEVQAMMIIAKRYPRDEQRAFSRILESCRRKGLADQAVYEYPRGGEKIEGPSIRLAEVMARAWGNLDFGVVELEQKNGESSVMAYAWDLETNTRQTKIFSVKHFRQTRKGGYSLSDPRDIYELVANQGARRMRACILGIIPGDITDAAIEECNKTMAGNNKEPIADRVRSMLAAFGELSVTQAMIEKRVQHKAADLTEREILRLRKIYAALRDGIAGIEQYFEVAPSDPVTADINKAVSKPTQSPPDEPGEVKAPEEEKSAPKVSDICEFPWLDFRRVLDDAATGAGYDMPTYDAALGLWLVSKKARTKEDKVLTAADKKALLEAVREKRLGIDGKIS
jgi:hypothetical protein